MAGLTLIFLGWVAFATVNVIFKDRIIAAKDHRYQQMQSAYENRVADLQISYDELNGALVSAEDRFKATADALADQAECHRRIPQPRQTRCEASLGGAWRAAPASVRQRRPAAAVSPRHRRTRLRRADDARLFGS